MDADFVGGAIRYFNGHWHPNCHQTVYKNYSLHYFPGYIKSERECLICDMFLGPIFGRTEKFKDIKFEKKFSEVILSPDFFLKVFSFILLLLHLLLTLKKRNVFNDQLSINIFSAISFLSSGIV